MDAIGDTVKALLGLDLKPEELGAIQMALRAVVVYAVTVAIVRLAKKRFMGRASAFDIILGIMLGSIVSRAVTGNAPFGPALAAGAALLSLHWLLSAIALRWHGFGTAIKGVPRLLVRDGRVDEPAMRASHMTANDLWEDLRGHSVSQLGEVAEAHLERNGRLSVLKAKPEFRVLEVQVAPGTQTVRIELGG